MNERDWVPCHRRLLKGAKKGLSRAVRFVLLELCHEARMTNGVLEFPPEWDTLTAVHDRIGGDRKEIRKALTIFQIQDATGAQVLQIDRDATEHRLQIVKWESWAGPKSAAERMKTHRERDVKIPTASRSGFDVTPTVQESREQESRSQRRTTPASETKVKVKLESVPAPPPDNPSQEPTGAALVNLLAKAYVDGIMDASGEQWRMQDASHEGPVILDAVLGHGSQLRGDRLIAWVKASASAYRRLMAAEAQYQKGFRPSKWLEWLNSGGEKMQHKQVRGAPLVQRDEGQPRAWKIGNGK